MAQICDQTDLHQDMDNIMKIVIEYDPVLNYDERNLLSGAYKNIVGSRRNSIRLISANIEDEQRQNKMDRVEKLSQYKEKYCLELIDIVDTKLLPVAKDAESRVFYIKLMADYYKYMCESKPESNIVNKCKIYLPVITGFSWLSRHY